ncbi:MAG: translational machinery protein [Polyangiaceae bacterium]
MTSPRHAAVWLDHHEAKIFHVDLEGFDERKIQSPAHHIHRHPKGASEPVAHPEDATHFFGEVAHALAGVEALLVVGPSTAKLQFLRYLREHDKTLEAKVVGIETVDRPTDPELVAHVKKYFHVSDPRVH